MLSLLVIFCLALTTCVKCQSLTLDNIRITWNLGATKSNFTVSSPLGSGLSLTNAWLGFGFNTAAQMNSANVIICKSRSNSFSIENYYNSFYFSSPLVSSNPSIGITFANAQIVNSSLTCSFTRDNVNSAQNYYRISNQTQYYIIAAYGSLCKILNK